MSNFKIYILENTVNHKIYVGMTSQSLQKRLQEHINSANAGRDMALHRAICKYGSGNFRIFEADTADSQEEASKKEREWIDLLGTYESQEYNETDGGEGGVTVQPEEAPAGVLTAEKVKAMRERFREDESLIVGDIAKEFGVGLSGAYMAIVGKTWSRIPGTVDKSKVRARKANATAKNGESNGYSKLTEELVVEMRTRYENEDISYDDLAKEYPASHSNVGKIINRETWSHV